MIDENMRPFIIYRCVIGSRAYGLQTESSDTDLRGCYLPPARMTWSLAKPPEQLLDDESQECYWELEKFLRLALRSNPNALECLHSPLVEHATPVAEELLSLKDQFASRLAFNTYLGYADAQFRRLESKSKADGPNWRHAMHLVRLLICGLSLIESGKVRVDVSEHRDLLLSIKNEDLSWGEVNDLRQIYSGRMEEALPGSPLPELPDDAAISDFLIRARRSMVDV
jgi:predicted nucleotidyltransferase